MDSKFLDFVDIEKGRDTLFRLMKKNGNNFRERQIISRLYKKETTQKISGTQKRKQIFKMKEGIENIRERVATSLLDCLMYIYRILLSTEQSK